MYCPPNVATQGFRCGLHNGNAVFLAYGYNLGNPARQAKGVHGCAGDQAAAARPIEQTARALLRKFFEKGKHRSSAVYYSNRSSGAGKVSNTLLEFGNLGAYRGNKVGIDTVYKVLAFVDFKDRPVKRDGAQT